MSAREMHKAVCSECGREFEVPFKPDPSRPIYWRECWSKRSKKAIQIPTRKRKIEDGIITFGIGAVILFVIYIFPFRSILFFYWIIESGGLLFGLFCVGYGLYQLIKAFLQKNPEKREP